MKLNFSTKVEKSGISDFITNYIVSTCLGLSIFLNSLLILLIISRKKLQTLPNYGLFSLCLADTIYALFSFPTLSIIPSELWNMSFGICIAIHQILIFSINVSVLTLVYMTFERFVAIVLPFKYYLIASTKKASILLICFWILSFFVSTLPYMYNAFEDSIFNTKTYIPHLCNFFTYQKLKDSLAWIILIVLCYVPICLMSIPIIVVVLRKRKQNQAANFRIEGDSNSEKSNMVYLLIIILLYNALVWSLHIGNIFRLRNVNVLNINILLSTDQSYIIVANFLLSSSLLDPLVYGFSRKSIRKEVYDVFKMIQNRFNRFNTRVETINI